MQISRQWAMPSPNTFSIKPIRQFVQKYFTHATVSIDPFAGNCDWATYTNDLNPATKAEHHMKARDFLLKLEGEHMGEGATAGIFRPMADLIIFDPPYSLRQAKECYERHGLAFLQKDSQDVGHWRDEKDAADRLLVEGGIFLSFGWSTAGIGKGGKEYSIEEIILVCQWRGAQRHALHGPKESEKNP